MIRGTKLVMHENAPGKNLEYNVKASIHNRFDIEVIDSKTKKVKTRAYAENVICNAAFKRLCSTNSWNTYIHYGSGSGTPSSADTSLFNFLGYQATTLYSTDYDYDANVYKVTRNCTLDETVAVGKTITEIGIAYGTSSTNLMTHAMLKDMNGNPISINKTNTDILRVYATVFCHFVFPKGLVVVGGYKNAGGTTQCILNHIAGITSMPAVVAGSSPGYAMRYDNTISITPSYDTTNYKITLSCRAGASVWNVGGIKALFIASGSYKQIEFIAEVDEDNEWFGMTKITGEPLATGDGSTKDFATKIHLAKNATVYVDNVVVDSSLSYGYLGDNIEDYFRIVRCEHAGCGNRNGQCAQFHYEGTDYKYSRNEKNLVLENTLCDSVGIATAYSNYFSSLEIHVSNDMVNWIKVQTTGSTTKTIPQEYRYYRYWNFETEHTTSYTGVTLDLTTEDEMPGSKNVHLSEAPPAGSVVTIDYDAICIGKDSNHVLDFSVVLSFSEHSETT